MELSTSKRQLPKLQLLKIPNRKKNSNENFKLFETEPSLAEIIKSINFQTNNKSPDNDGIKTVFYKNFQIN